MASKSHAAVAPAGAPNPWLSARHQGCAHIQAILICGLVVAANHVLTLRDVPALQEVVIVCSLGYGEICGVRLWEHTQQCLPIRIDPVCRNHVTRERLPAKRVADWDNLTIQIEGLREVAATLQRGGNRNLRKGSGSSFQGSRKSRRRTVSLCCG